MKDFIQNYKVYEDGSIQRIAEGAPGSPKSIVGRFLKQERMKNGYYRVALCNKGVVKRISVHRLVAMVHLPNPNNYPLVNHKDGDKSNNHISNLEWCDNSHNQLHAYNELGKDRMFGTKRYNAVLDDDKVRYLRSLSEPDFRKLGKELGCSPSTIADAYHGRTWSHI